MRLPIIAATLALVGATYATPVLANSDGCWAFRDSASYIMDWRQNGWTPDAVRQELHSTVGSNIEVFEPMVQDAFATPVYSNPIDRRAIIQEFGRYWYDLCVDAFD